MLVRALEACFPEGRRRRKGEEFDYAGKELPAHLIPVKGAPAKVIEATAEQPIALSELAKGSGKLKSFVESVAKK